MCSSMRYICMPNIKFLSKIFQKLLQKLKLAQTNQPTNQQTNQPTDQQTGQKQYIFPSEWEIPYLQHFRLAMRRPEILGEQLMPSACDENPKYTYIHIRLGLQAGSASNSPLMVRDPGSIQYYCFAHLRGFHDDWAKNVTSRVFTSFFYYINIRKLPPPPRQPCYSTDRKHFQTQLSYQRNKCSENWAKHLTSRVFTCFHYIHIEKIAPPTGRHVFSPIWTIFELIRHINKTNVLINFYDNWAKIVTSRVLTRFLFSHIRTTASPTGGNLHEDWKLNVTSTVFTSFFFFFDPVPYFKLDRDIIGTNLLTKFHEDRTINVASTVFTNKCGRTDGRTTEKDQLQKLKTRAVTI
ncbi:hypothetical protein DPMN_029367 [Dreissena polymorpha]|uniref:Uncharacterized protein n=1 Tax=Dreissena polymorpha TaxID=45954 RepID=A0A9D4LZ27_DREPO|nr:hypothetical protein DPMN_029367 [Dreissena polymorpha]